MIAFTGRVRLNAAFAAVLRENNVVLDESSCSTVRITKVAPETSAVFAAITRLAANAFPDFEIERHIILGCFMDPASQMLVESRKIIDQFGARSDRQYRLGRFVGRQSAAEALEGAEIPGTVRLMPILMASMRSAMRTIPSDTPRSLLPRAIRCLWIVRSPTIPPGRARRLRRVA